MATQPEFVQLARDLVALKFMLWEHAFYIHTTSCQYKQAEEVR